MPWRGEAPGSEGCHGKKNDGWHAGPVNPQSRASRGIMTALVVQKAKVHTGRRGVRESMQEGRGVFVGTQPPPHSVRSDEM